MSEMQYLTHIRAFFSLPYGSMPAEKKYSTAHKILDFRCEAVLKEKIFVTARQKSVRNTRLFQRFLTQMWRKDAFQNHMRFECIHLKVTKDRNGNNHQ